MRQQYRGVVCCIETTDLDGIAKVRGTGFHLGRGWTVTNAHVVVEGLCLSNSVVTYRWMDAGSKAERRRTFESQNRIGFISKHTEGRKRPCYLQARSSVRVWPEV